MDFRLISRVSSYIIAKCVLYIANDLTESKHPSGGLSVRSHLGKDDSWLATSLTMLLLSAVLRGKTGKDALLIEG